jgi:hypothetical protein
MTALQLYIAVGLPTVAVLVALTVSLSTYPAFAKTFVKSAQITNV